MAWAMNITFRKLNVNGITKQNLRDTTAPLQKREKGEHQKPISVLHQKICSASYETIFFLLFIIARKKSRKIIKKTEPNAGGFVNWCFHFHSRVRNKIDLTHFPCMRMKVSKKFHDCCD